MENLLVPYQATLSLPSKSVLVLAPHPDDEVFGCGGAIMRHVAQGIPVRVIVVSEGGHGVPSEEQASYIRQRQHESEEAAKILGYGAPLFWSYRDREISYGEKLINEILAAIDETTVDLIYAPSIWEIHPDHRAVGMAVVEAVRRIGKAVRLALYEVGMPLRPNCLLDISDLVDRKMKAMQCFVSQNEKQRYDLNIAALNRYRTYTLPAEVTSAEAYVLVSAEELANDVLKLYQAEHIRQKSLGLPLAGRDIPLVSVIIRSMDRPTLSDALDSIALQTYSNIEVVVVNAKGGRHTELDEKHFHVILKLINQGGRGLSRVRAANIGLDAAQGEWLLFLDDDDTIDPDHIHRLMHGAQTSLARVVYTGVRIVDQHFGERYHLDEEWDRTRLWQANFMPIHAVLFQHSLLASGAKFDERFDVYEDWDFWAQLALETPFMHIPGLSATYRLAGNSGLSNDSDSHFVLQARSVFYEKWRSKIPPHELATAFARAEEARTLNNKLRDSENKLRDSENKLQMLDRDYQMSRSSLAKMKADFQGMQDAYGILERDRAALLASTSWRVTSPLRWIMTKLRKSGFLRRSIFRACRAIYHALPINSTLRIRLRSYALRSPMGRILQKLWGGGLISGGQYSETLSIDKEKVRAESHAALVKFLESNQKLYLPSSASPVVSILLVLYNQAGLTYRCLKALSEERGVTFETLIVDNASEDATHSLLDRIEGARIIRNQENEGFLLACNRAAKIATGEFLLFLNNDAVLLPGALSAAVTRLQNTPDAGAVGGKILLWSGRLQEAGSIIWQDGSCVGYGRDEDPDDSIFSHVRDVDYCSGAFLLTRRALFESMGQFDIDYAPAYYEESDYCARLWQSGYRVIYDPAIRIRHFEFASSDAKSERAFNLQKKNRSVFISKQQVFLQSQWEPSAANVLLARQRFKKGCRRVLFIDDRLPRRDLGSGFPRALEFIESLVEAGCFVTHYPLQFPHELWEEARQFLPETVEIAANRGVFELQDFLEARQDFYHAIIVSRPHNMVVLNSIISCHSEWFSGKSLIYDAEAMFSLREIIQAEVNGKPFTPEKSNQLIRDELAITKYANRIITVSQAEADHFLRYGKKNVFVLGHALDIAQKTPGFQERTGYLFIGAMPSDASPNADSLIWFLRHVWPMITAQGAAHLDIVGLCEAPTVMGFASDTVRIHGRVDNVSSFYANARLFIVPTRFAAGIPHKAHEAAAQGLPMVVTPLIASQLGWEEEVAVGESPSGFAKACIALYNDPILWEAKRVSALKAVEHDCNRQHFQKTVEMILADQQVIEQNRE